MRRETSEWMRPRRGPLTASPTSRVSGCARTAAPPPAAAVPAAAAAAPAGGGAAAAGPTTGDGPQPGGRGGGVALEPATAPFPYDPTGPPVATFFEAGGNMEGGLPYTPWAADIRKKRLALNARDNPDAMCMPMGFLQFHQQPQPRRIYHMDKLILIEYEANYGLRRIYLDRKLPAQGDVNP